MKLTTSYLLTKTRFRVDSSGECVDQRQETLDQLAKMMIDATTDGPITYEYGRGGAPTATFKVRIPLDHDPPVPTPADIARAKFKKRPHVMVDEISTLDWSESETIRSDLRRLDHEIDFLRYATPRNFTVRSNFA